MPTTEELVIAVDPGKLTGVAWITDERAFNSTEYDTWDAVGWVDGKLSHPRVEVRAVVCEAYVITKQTLMKTRGDNWSLESLGALRYLCLEHGVPLIVQTAADAKSFATNAKLEAMGWRRPSSGGHRDDAARHLLLYLVRAGALDVVRFAQGGEEP